jgi:excinuclease ABC subunit A
MEAKVNQTDNTIPRSMDRFVRIRGARERNL